MKISHRIPVVHLTKIQPLLLLTLTLALPQTTQDSKISILLPPLTTFKGI